MAKKKAPPNPKNWQDAQILSDDTYFEETKDSAQRRSWTFYEAIKIDVPVKSIPMAKVKVPPIP